MSTVIKIRQAQRNDLEQIIALLADDPLGSKREDASLPLAQYYIDAFAAVNTDHNQLLTVAVDETNQVIGTMQISFIPSVARKGAWRGQIEAVRVAKDHRSSGLGQQLMEWAINKCRERGCSLVQLTTDKTRPDAHRFYDRLGFAASHIGYKLIL